MLSTPRLALALLLAAAPLAAQSASDDAAVRALVDRFANAREAQDPQALETLFTGDADQLVSSGEWRKGRDQLVAGMLRSSQGNPGDRTIAVETVRFLDAGTAIADARYEIAASGGNPARRMWSTFVARREGGQWRIAAIRNMLPAR